MVAVAESEVRKSAEGLTNAMRSIERAFLIGVPEATEVLLVRHGDCYEGMTALDDPPLSPIGIEQARALGARMRRLRPDAVYSSPLRRARQTAEAITPEFRVEPRLLEVTTDLERGHVEVAEDPTAVLARMTAAIDEAVAEHEGGRVVMVGHAMSILAYLCHVLRVEFGSLRLLPYYTSINMVRVLGDRRMIGSLADTAHLENLS